MFRSILSFFKFEKPIETIEDKLFVVVCQIVFLLAFIVSFFNFFISVSVLVNINILFISIPFLIIYKRASKHGISNTMRIQVVVLSILFNISGWFLNGGMLGSHGYLIALIIVMSMLLLDYKLHKKLLGFYLVLLCSLIVVEKYFPQLVFQFSTHDQQLLNTFFKFSIVIVVLGVLVYTFKKSYEEERAQLLKTQKDLIASKNELREAKEVAEKATLTKSMFLANMSHELRTPLNGIIGVADLIQLENSKEEQTELVKTLATSSELLLNVINDILDISKIEAGKVTLTTQAFDLLALLKQVENFINYRIKDAAKPVEFSMTLSPQLQQFVIGDESRLKQVLFNLLSNAVKFTPKGEVGLNVDVKDTDTKRQQIRFTVTDTGIGIQEDKLSQLFTPFYQVDNSASKQFGGTGLGLSICKNLVELMHGNIFAASELGKGSRFVIEMPFLIPESQINTVEASIATPIDFVKADIAILVAEDNRMNQLIATKIFKALGHSISIAENGRDAVESFAQNNFDVVFMDVQMPLMDGLEATRKIRSIPNGDKVIIVGVTANAMKEDELACMEAGMNYFLPKPITVNKVRSLLHQIFNYVT